VGPDGGGREGPLEDPTKFPPAVREAAGSDVAWERLCGFAAMLAAEGETRGLIGPREMPRLWSRHIVNSMALNAFVPDGARVADVGTGAGFPGVVLAITRPDTRLTLVESMERRCEWLEDVRLHLGLDNVRVINARAEEFHGRGQFAVVTARAVAALDKLARWTLPLVEPGGRLLALKGARAGEEFDAAESVFRSLGARTGAVHAVSSPLDGSTTYVVEIVKWS